MRRHSEFGAGKRPSEIAAPPNSTPVTGIAAETVITVHGKIVAVDPASKQVTFQGPSGKTVTLTINNPYNLQSLKAGPRFPRDRTADRAEATSDSAPNRRAPKDQRRACRILGAGKSLSQSDPDCALSEVHPEMKPRHAAALA